MKHTVNDHTYELLKKAPVKAIAGFNEHKHRIVTIEVGDYQHRFEATSRVSRHLETATIQDLQARLSGGTFFFVDDQLMDWRYANQSDHFIHGDNAIAHFMEKIGVKTRPTRNMRQRRAERLNEYATGSELILAKTWSDLDFDVPVLQEGGNFNSQLTFTWSPFRRTIDTSYELMRLICTNGMVGVTSWLNNKVPVINKWEEHLNLASNQIQDRVIKKVRERTQQMILSRANVADCQLVENHAFKRSQLSDNYGDIRQRINAIMLAASPETHLSQYYKPLAFEDKNVASYLASHLTQMDLYNLCTELNSHTLPTKDSSSAALDRLANRLMFDDDVDARRNSFASTPALSHDSDPDRAFFGELSIIS